MPEYQSQIELIPNDAKRLAALCGHYDANLKLLESNIGVLIKNRGHHFEISGNAQDVDRATALLQKLYADTQDNLEMGEEYVHLNLQQNNLNQLVEQSQDAVVNGSSLSVAPSPSTTTSTTPPTAILSTTNTESIDGIKTRRKIIRPRGINQINYVDAIRNNDINFGIGPAGTGKTWLAVACAVEALEQSRVERILLVRPAVEAGEKLGFLPGDLSQKIDPYLRPLYDALYEMMGVDNVSKRIERNTIEVAPLAFMRGRTLNNSFIILDESQNTTREQMKMFLTRIGFGSTAVITGDDTQIDLPHRRDSGLLHVKKVLGDTNGITFTAFNSKDVVRHPLVQRIVEAYAAHDDQRDNNNKS